MLLLTYGLCGLKLLVYAALKYWFEVQVVGCVCV